VDTGRHLFSASQRTYTALFSLDPATRAVRKHQAHDGWIGSQFSVSKDGARVAFVGAGATEFPDVYAGAVTAHRGRAAQAADFDRSAYPLLVVIHGGPTGIAPAPYGSASVYPIDGLARAARWCSSPTTAAAPATARSSAR
jgi:dipeptidyl aminopeptidase/acylaminoacyl peptidase